MWQKAQVIKGDEGLIGRTFWVKAEKPTETICGEMDISGLIFNRTRVANVESNIIDPSKHRACVHVDIGDIELLGEFADDVPLISIREFLHQ